MANTCLMLAVITLYYFPSLVHCSFVFVVTLSRCYLLTIILIFLVFMIISFSIVYYFILFFVTNIVITSPYGGVLVLCQRQKHFIFFMFCYLLGAYIFCIVASLINLGLYIINRFRNFMSR